MSVYWWGLFSSAMVRVPTNHFFVWIEAIIEIKNSVLNKKMVRGDTNQGEAFHSVNYVVCRDKIYILKQAIELVLYQCCILHIFCDELVLLDHHNIRNANYLV